jgi:hypothetical protein
VTEGAAHLCASGSSATPRQARLLPVNPMRIYQSAHTGENPKCPTRPH